MSAQAVLFEPEPTVSAPSQIGRARVSRRVVRQILTKATGVVSGFYYTLNPYVGCTFGCEYCYAAFFQPDDAKAKDWGYWVEYKDNALDLLRADSRVAGAKVYMGSVTDPYQPLERKTRITRSLVEHMAKLSPQPRLVVQTRSPIVIRDIDVLQRMQDVRVNMTVTTDSDDVRKRYEPACASIERRLDAVRQLVDAGVQTHLSLSPLLPVRDVSQFAQKIRDSGAAGVWAGYFHPGTRKFASGTRENALVLAKQDGWCFEEFIKTVNELKRLVPNFVDSHEAFGTVG